MTHENEQLVRRWHEEGINQQQPDLAFELCTDDFQFHFAFNTPVNFRIQGLLPAHCGHLELKYQGLLRAEFQLVG